MCIIKPFPKRGQHNDTKRKKENNADRNKQVANNRSTTAQGFSEVQKRSSNTLIHV